jgi:hypothetical protein
VPAAAPAVAWCCRKQIRAEALCHQGHSSCSRHLRTVWQWIRYCCNSIDPDMTRPLPNGEKVSVFPEEQ